MKFGPDGIERRIKNAGDEYVEGEIDEEELEDRIERAMCLEYTYGELLCCSEFIRVGPENRGMVFGREVPPGESVRLDDEFDVDIFEYDVCPY